MPGGLTLLISNNVDIPTPASGKVTVFFSVEEGGPAYKNDVGVVFPLEGPTGGTGPMGLPGFGFDGEDGDVGISVIGPQGIQGLTGVGGPVGPMMVVDDNQVGDDAFPATINITNKKTICLDINGNGVVITTGVKGYIQIPIAMTLTGWTILSIGGLSGSIVIDVWLDTYANFPPTVLDTITAAAKPTVTGTNKNNSNILTGWLTSIPAGSVLGFNVDSITTLQHVILELYGSVD